MLASCRTPGSRSAACQMPGPTRAGSPPAQNVGLTAADRCQGVAPVVVGLNVEIARIALGSRKPKGGDFSLTSAVSASRLPSQFGPVAHLPFAASLLPSLPTALPSTPSNGEKHAGPVW